MKIDTKIIAAVILTAGISYLGFSIRNGIITFKDRDRVVYVKGLAEREVKADKVTWALSYKDLGNDPSEMYDNIERKNRKLVAFLKEGGITDNEISIGSPTIVDRQADNYGNEIMNYRYKAKSVITVTSNDVDKVRKLLKKQAELMKQGIALVNDEYGGEPATYEFTGLNKIKPEMVEEATKNARATAQKFAEDSDCKLGGIRSAQQGYFEIENRDENTPYIKKVRVVNTLQYSLE